jgi:5-methyltetrahydropteroyltriglutamate--homocysteine methyltransferase
MKILAVHAGGFPRVGDTLEQQRLRAARGAFDRGEITEEKLADTENDMVREVLSLQSKAGLDLVSDGQVRWQDPVSHVMDRLEGVRAGRLARYFDTNTYYRQPQVVGAIAARGPLTAEEFRFARAISPRPVTATLTGPFTLSRLCLPGGPYKSGDDLLAALAPIIAGEVGQLAAAGAGNIIIEEPFLSRETQSIGLLADALEVLGGAKGSARLWLRLSFGDYAPLYGALQKLPVDGLMLDFTCSARLAEVVASAGSDLALGLGLVDTRNTRMENYMKTARVAALLMKKIHAGECWLTASTGVDFLPRNRAVEKLALLARMRDFLAGKAGSARKKAVPRRKLSRKPRPVRSRAAKRNRAKKPKGRGRRS